MLSLLLRNNRKHESSGETSVGQEKEGEPRQVKIDTRDGILSVAFIAEGKRIVSGDYEGEIRWWNVENGEELHAPMNPGSIVQHVAVSKDGDSIVGATRSGLVAVWNRTRRIDLVGHSDWVRAVDISPDGSRVVSGSDDCTVRVWSRKTGKQILGPWKHEHYLRGIKFSPNGLLIATATWDSIRIYNSQNGNLLVKVPVQVRSETNHSLAWDSNSNQFYVLSRHGVIYCLGASSGKTITQWAIHSDRNGCIVLPRNNKFIVAASGSSISFWDTTTHEQIGSIFKHSGHIWSMALSEDYDLAMGGDEGITLLCLRDILPSHYVDTVSLKHTAPLTLDIIHTSPAMLELCRKDDLLKAISLVTQEMKQTDKQEHLLANRAILRARLHQWNSAIRDARKSIAIKPTILAHVAFSMALFGQEFADRAKKEFNQLFCCCDVDDVYFISLVKAIVIFTGGNYEEGMARVADLVAVFPDRDATLSHIIQAHMYVISGKAYLAKGQYDMVLKPLDHLRGPLHVRNHPQFECISVIFGWTRDSCRLKFELYQQRCETLYALQRREEAMGLFRIASKDLDARKEVKEWLRDFAQRCGSWTDDVAIDPIIRSASDSLINPYGYSRSRNRLGRIFRFPLRL